MRFHEDQHGDILVLTPLAGPDVETPSSFLSRLDALHPLETPAVLVDLSQVGFLASCAVGCLLHTGVRFRDGGGRIAITGLGPRMRDSLAAIGLLEIQLFGVHDSREDGLRALAAESPRRQHTAENRTAAG